MPNLLAAYHRTKHALHPLRRDHRPTLVSSSRPSDTPPATAPLRPAEELGDDGPFPADRNSSPHQQAARPAETASGRRCSARARCAKVAGALPPGERKKTCDLHLQALKTGQKNCRRRTAGLQTATLKRLQERAARHYTLPALTQSGPGVPDGACTMHRLPRPQSKPVHESAWRTLAADAAQAMRARARARRRVGDILGGGGGLADRAGREGGEMAGWAGRGRVDRRRRELNQPV